MSITMGLIKKRSLEIMLERLKDYENPRPEFEQYSLTASDAAKILWMSLDDISGRIILDPGCGPGRLLIGAALLGAHYAIGIDIDQNVLRITKYNIKMFNLGAIIDVIVCDYSYPCIRYADTIIQNPPFGVQKRHMDRIFIKSSSKIANVIYSIHKASNSDFLLKFYEKNMCKVEKIFKSIILLKMTMRHHKKRLYRVQVEIYKAVVQKK
ncbi:MAG: METTL5 family protein [Thermoprotei archaeon]